MLESQGNRNRNELGSERNGKQAKKASCLLPRPLYKVPRPLHGPDLRWLLPHQMVQSDVHSRLDFS